MIRLLLTTLVLLILTTANFAQDTVRIMTYNVLRYPDHADTRNEHLARAVRTADPDILVLQEMKSQEGVDMFLDAVMTREYSAGTFKDGNGNDTDNAIFYKHSIFEFIDHIQFYADPRRISQFRVVHSESLDTLLLYGVHLKASQGTDNENRRNASAEAIRDITDDLDEGTPFILLGDFNIYTSSESAYQTLLNQQESGYFLDPIDSPGNWHNSFSFRYIHTQSTRTGNLPDGGASGGLDDRFDMILISEGIDDKAGIKIDKASYTAYGNDGGHFNKSINEQPNNAVSAEIADALYYASDHLPVYADFVFPEVTDVLDYDFVISDFKLSQNYPNPFNPSTVINYSIPAITKSPPGRGRPEGEGGLLPVKLLVYDLLGREVATLVDKQQRPGNYSVQFSAGGGSAYGGDAGKLSSGVYFYQLRAGSFTDIKKMLMIK